MFLFLLLYLIYIFYQLFARIYLEFIIITDLNLLQNSPFKLIIIVNWIFHLDTKMKFPTFHLNIKYFMRLLSSFFYKNKDISNLKNCDLFNNFIILYFLILDINLSFTIFYKKIILYD